MKFKAGPAVLGVVLGMLVFALVASPHSGKQPQAGENTASPTPAHTPTPSSGKLTEVGKIALNKRVQAFLKAYYLLMPADTTQSRRERIASFVPVEDQKKFLAGLGLGVSTTTEADKARIERKWVQQAESIRILKQGPTGYDPTVIVVDAKLDVTMRTPHHQKVGVLMPIRVNTLWQQQSGNWVLRSFREGGDIE